MYNMPYSSYEMGNYVFTWVGAISIFVLDFENWFGAEENLRLNDTSFS